jgi:hypothetical protein
MSVDDENKIQIPDFWKCLKIKFNSNCNIGLSYVHVLV